jgi:acyl-coenzyme A synthetase/AMP-(fatty) acid ligase
LLLEEASIKPGQAILIEADFSPGSIALMLAAVHNCNIVVPVAAGVPADRQLYAQITGATHRIIVGEADTYQVEETGVSLVPELVQKLVDSGAPGLVLFSSGSTGEPKASLHDLSYLLEKYKVPRHKKCIISFLLFDHIGGFNTLMYTLSNLGTLVALHSRDADEVCRAIEANRVQILPTSPTFLNLMLISEAHRGRDMSSLELITYGTEMMPKRTLERLNEEFPGLRLLQTYGLSELGILRSKSMSSDSLWVKVGGEDYETRVVDGILHIRARCSMLGYLNAPSPFDSEGWFNTYDEVDVQGEWLRFKGRKSEIINVGGEKVYPAEVESVILAVENVTDVTVSGEKNPITGNIVVAAISLSEAEPKKVVVRRIRKHCASKLARYKIPVRFRISDELNVSARFKKNRGNV